MRVCYRGGVFCLVDEFKKPNSTLEKIEQRPAALLPESAWATDSPGISFPRHYKTGAKLRPRPALVPRGTAPENVGS